MRRGEMHPGGGASGRLRLGRAILLVAAITVAAVAAAPAVPPSATARVMAQSPEGVQIQGPFRVAVRNLPSAAPAPPGQGRSPAQPRRPSPPAPGANNGTPAANAGDRFLPDQPVAAPAPSGAGFEGLDNTNNAALAGVTLTPPDPQLGVGPDHVFEMINILGRIYTRGGGTVQTFTLASFFGVPAGWRDTDPKVFYDALSGRWFASYASFLDLAGGSNDQARLHIAISQTSDPTGAWNVYFLAYAQLFPDYPGIGVTNDKFTVSSNVFDIDQPFYFGAETLVFEKADVLAGVPGPSVGLSAFPRDLNRFTVRPAQSLSAGNDQYLTVRSSSSSTTLTIIRITGTPDAGNVTEASATNLPMLSQNAPPDSVASGGNIDSGDSRLLDAMWRNGRLWTSASAACLPPGDGTTRSCAHVIEVNTAVTPPTVLQDIMFGAASQYYSWPALRTDASGDLYVSLTHTNSGIFAEARATGRLANDPPNTMTGSVLLGAGDIAHDSARWGDYLGAAVDPLFPECVWLVGEYAKNTSGANWGTFIARTSHSGGCDGDNDSWSDTTEITIGTNPALGCGVDAWPADINNDGVSDISDIVAVGGNFGKAVPPAPARHNVAPDPLDTVVDITDIVRVGSLFGKSCSP